MRTMVAVLVMMGCGGGASDVMGDTAGVEVLLEQGCPTEDLYDLASVTCGNAPEDPLMMAEWIGRVRLGGGGCERSVTITGPGSWSGSTTWSFDGGDVRVEQPIGSLSGDTGGVFPPVDNDTGFNPSLGVIGISTPLPDQPGWLRIDEVDGGLRHVYQGCPEGTPVGLVFGPAH